MTTEYSRRTEKRGVSRGYDATNARKSHRKIGIAATLIWGVLTSNGRAKMSVLAHLEHMFARSTYPEKNERQSAFSSWNIFLRAFSVHAVARTRVYGGEESVGSTGARRPVRLTVGCYHLGREETVLPRRSRTK